RVHVKLGELEIVGEPSGLVRAEPSCHLVVPPLAPRSAVAVAEAHDRGGLIGIAGGPNGVISVISVISVPHAGAATRSMAGDHRDNATEIRSARVVEPERGPCADCAAWVAHRTHVDLQKPR